MGQRTGIEWTDVTWNPTTGCTKVSAGCDNCYAETLARRLLRGVYTRRLPVVDNEANRAGSVRGPPVAGTSRAAEGVVWPPPRLR